RRAAWPGLAFLLLSPLLLAASDPSGDLVSCDGTSVPRADAPIDAVAARGPPAEEVFALKFTITFAAPRPVPDEEGSPLRVDVLLLDPSVPDVKVDYYR